MQVSVHVNGQPLVLTGEPGITLLDALRGAGFFSVKRGCDHGECGACAVLLDGKQVNSCHVLLAQVDGCCIQTAEGLGEAAEQGWKHTAGLHPLQQAFIELGAVQCGYCTPAQLLASQELLDRKGYGGPEPQPLSETDVREALSGVLCRCTGYAKPVAAVLKAAAQLRGEEPPSGGGAQPEDEGGLPVALDYAGNEPRAEDWPGPEPARGGVTTRTEAPPTLLVTAPGEELRVVGKSVTKVDAAKLSQGKPAFTDDLEMRGMLIGKIMHSPVAHARIKSIDVTAARQLPGVAAVLTYKDVPRVAHCTAGQTHPLPSPLDTFSLDHKVRFVGDRVALIAAESEEIALAAMELIRVEYEELPAIDRPARCAKPGAPIIHDEPDFRRFRRIRSDAQPRCAHLRRYRECGPGFCGGRPHLRGRVPCSEGAAGVH